MARVGVAGRDKPHQGFFLFDGQLFEGGIDPVHDACPSFRFSNERGHDAEVLVAAAREVDHEQVLLRAPAGLQHGPGQGVGAFQRRDDPLQGAQGAERVPAPRRR